MSLESIYEGLTDEQKERARACKTPEDMLALVKETGIVLTDEEVEAVSGGGMWSNDCRLCPKDSQAWS